MSKSIVGARIRERRRALGITQAELARRIGISGSYLNLIERNRRGLSGNILQKVAAALDLKVDELDGAAERRLHELLTTIADDPRLASLAPEADAVGELIGRYPGWARAIGALARAEREATDLSRALSDRLTHDPFLGEAVYRVATRTAAIRSTAEILESVPDIDPEQAARFHRIISVESRTLSEVAEALGAYFDKVATPARSVTPVDEVEALFDRAANRFPALDRLLDDTPPPATDAEALDTAETLTGAAIEALIADAPEIETASARARAHKALIRHAADALRAPAIPFAEAAAAVHFDLEALTERLGLPQDLVCRRLTALPQTPRQPRFGYLATNAAGATLELRSLPGFHPSRHGTICPRWVLCRAMLDPGRALCQRAVFPSGEQFLFVARARLCGPSGFGHPRHYETDMIVIPAADAELTVYAAAAMASPVEEVGAGCRSCPRRGCVQRVEDPLTGWGAAATK